MLFLRYLKVLVYAGVALGAHAGPHARAGAGRRGEVGCAGIMAEVSVSDVTRSFDEGGRRREVLRGISFDVAGGELCALLGRSGSGKSTLLNLISGIDAPDAGTVEFAGAAISAMAEPARTLFRRAHIGFIYQFFNLIPTLDVEENVRLVLELNGVRGREAQARSRRVLGEVGLAERAHSAVDQLSGGEQQRVAIARAVVHAPALLLADEPTGNLDEATAREIIPVLLSLARARGATLIIVTHDAALARRADRVLELRDGRLHETAVAP
jgi:putative ABC transport system ATP-binding protein